MNKWVARHLDLSKEMLWSESSLRVCVCVWRRVNFYRIILAFHKQPVAVSITTPS